MNIRQLIPSDNYLAVSKIFQKSWQEAYRNSVPQKFLDELPADLWVERLKKPGRKTLVAIQENIYIGLVGYGASRTKSPEFVDWGEIMAIYLLPEYQGFGYGKKLLKEAVEKLQEEGYQKIFLWVLAKNISARRFYENNGFFPTSNQAEITIGGKKLKEIQYVYQKSNV